MALRINSDTEYVICCDICTEVSNIFRSDTEFRKGDTPSKYFKREGWIEKEGKNLCPECAGKN